VSLDSVLLLFIFFREDFSPERVAQLGCGGFLIMGTSNRQPPHPSRATVLVWNISGGFF